MEQLAAAVALAVEIDFFESAVGIEGHAGVEEEVSVVDGVHAAVGEEAFDVLLQLVADAEGVVQLAHELGLLGGELEGVCRVEGGEEGVGHLVSDTARRGRVPCLYTAARGGPASAIRDGAGSSGLRA